VVLLVLCIAWMQARLPVSAARRLLRGTCYLYLGLLGFMGLFAVGWVFFAHHASQTDFSQGPFDLNGSNITFYSTVILACLGIQLPLNMAGEVREPRAVSRYLPRTVLVVVFGYLLVWFAMAVLLPQDPTNPFSAGNPGNIGQMFAVALGQSVPGQVISALASLVLCAFYIVSSGAYGMVQSRLLVVASLDRRLPLALSQLDQQGVPRAATTCQFVIQALIALVIFLLAPALSAQGAAYETIVYTVLSASGVVLWAISALALFAIGAILVLRFPEQARLAGGASSALVILSGVIGAAATLACIWLVFIGPWITLLSAGDWFFWVMFLVLASLAVGAVYSFLAPEPADIWTLFGRTQPTAPGR
jgi:glutamate:GABA antiporter